MSALQKGEAGESGLYDSFQSLDQGDYSFIERLEEARRILHWNQREELSSGYGPSEKQHPPSHHVIADALLRWLLKKVNVLKDESESPESRLSFWRLLASLVDGVPSGAIRNQLPAANLAEAMLLELERIETSCSPDTVTRLSVPATTSSESELTPRKDDAASGTRKRKRISDTAVGPRKKPASPSLQMEVTGPQDMDVSLFLAVGDVLRRIKTKLSADVDDTDVRDNQMLIDCLSVTPLLTARLLALACELVLLQRLASEKSSNDMQTVRSMLDPFIDLWTAKVSVDTDANDHLSTNFRKECLDPALAILSQLRRGGNCLTVTEIEIFIQNHAIKSARKAFMDLEEHSDEKATRLALDQHLAQFPASIRFCGEHESFLYLPPQHESTPSGILFGLALKNLPGRGSARREAEELWLRSLFLYLAFQHGQMLSESQTSQIAMAHQRALREIIWLYRKNQLRVSRSKLQEILQYHLSYRANEESPVVDWPMVTDCIMLDPYWALADSNSKQEHPLASLLTRARSLTKSRERPSPLPHEDGVFARSPEYDAAVSYFALGLLDIYDKARRLTSFIRFWSNEVEVVRKEALQGSDRPAEISVWEDERLSAGISSKVESSLMSDQMLSMLQEAQGKLSRAAHSQNVKAEEMFPVLLMLSTTISGIVSDNKIQPAQDTAAAIHSQISTLLLSKTADATLNARLWDVESRLLERWPSIMFGDDQTDTREVLAARAVKTCKRALKANPDDASHSDHAEAFVFICTLFDTYKSSRQLSHAESKALKESLDISRRVARRHLRGSAAEAETQQKAALCMRAIIEHPRCLSLASPEDQLDFLTTLLAAGFPKCRHTTEEDGSTSTLCTQSNRFLPMWSQLVKSDAVQREPKVLENVIKTEMVVATGLVRSIGTEPSECAVSKVSLFFRNALLENWSRAFRDELADTLLGKMAAIDSISKTLLGTALSLSLSLRRRPLAADHPSREWLKELLTEQSSGSKSGWKPGRNQDGSSEILVSALRRLLGDQDTRTGTTKLRDYLKDLRGTKAAEASTTIQEFASMFKASDCAAQIDCIRTLTRTCKRDAHGSTLMFILQTCKTQFRPEDRRSELKSAIGELIGELMAVASRSQSPRCVVSAVRCITLLLCHNAWAIEQIHIDECLVLVEVLSHKASSAPQPGGMHAAVLEPAQQKSALNIGSAKRMLLNSLGIRVPRTQDEMDKLRQRSGAEKTREGAAADDSSPPQRTAEQAADERKLATCLFKALCGVLGRALQFHRVKLNLRWGLVQGALQALLAVLFDEAPQAGSAADEMFGSAKPWITGAELGADSAAEWARLLTAICDPTPSTVRPSNPRPKSKNGHSAELNDVTKKARSLAGRHMAPLLQEYCRLRLRSTLGEDKRAALTPGLYAILDAMSKDAAEDLNDMLSRHERDIFRGVLGEHKLARRGSGR